MKLKVLITVLSGIILVICLVISLKSPDNSTADKWSSFGMGFCAALFIGGMISIIAYRSKKKEHESAV